jgi:hypothetical protein
MMLARRGAAAWLTLLAASCTAEFQVGEAPGERAPPPPPFRSLATALTDAAPTFKTTTTPPLAKRGSAVRTQHPPLLTNSWQSVLGIGDGSGQFTPQPYRVAAGLAGLDVCLPKVRLSATNVNGDCSVELRVGTADPLSPVLVSATDELSISLGFEVATAPQCGQEYTFLQQDMDVDGIGLAQGHADEPEDCCAQCSALPSCNGFAWLGGSCYLKANSTHFASKSGVVSAMRTHNGSASTIRQDSRSSGSSSSSSGGGGGSAAVTAATPALSFPIVRGSPYITAFFNRPLQPTMAVQGSTLQRINGQAVPTAPAGTSARPLNLTAQAQWTLELSSGATWLLFTERPIAISATAAGISGRGDGAKYTGWMRLAAVSPTAAAAEAQQIITLLTKHSHAIPLGGTVDFGLATPTTPLSPSQPVGRLSFRYEQWQPAASTRSEKQYRETTSAAPPPLLMLAAPHHVAQALADGGLPRPPPLVPAADGRDGTQGQGAYAAYNTTIGLLSFVTGSQWELALPLAALSWSPPHGIRNCTEKGAVAAALATQQYFDPGPFSGRNSSVYWYDKGLWKLGRLASIATALGADDIAATLLSTLKLRLTPLLAGTSPNALVYEPGWGGIVAHDSLLSSWIDFGAGQYNVSLTCSCLSCVGLK